MHQIITRHFDVPRMNELAVARQHGAYITLPRLFRMQPKDVVRAVVESGLRGRGGAGFPTGKKWGLLPKRSEGPVYLVVNADESEPGTFKDRAIIERDPHLLIEGMMIAAYAIGAARAFVYFRGEYSGPARVFTAALEEVSRDGLLSGDAWGEAGCLDVVVHKGAGAYICGEESALLNSIEGKRGLARIRPPFPTEKGLFGSPTIVNNVETLSSLPFIIREGAAAYRAIGTKQSPGTKLISISGHVMRPGVYELDMGTPVSQLIDEHAGGLMPGRRLKAILPGGVSVPVLADTDAATARIDFESIEKAGSKLGSGGMIVMDDTTCMVRALSDIARFFAHESCGKCTPCREGTGWIMRILDRMENGKGRPGDIDTLLDAAHGMKDRAICGLADSLAAPVASFVAKFRKEFEVHVRTGRCPMEK